MEVKGHLASHVLLCKFGHCMWSASRWLYLLGHLSLIAGPSFSGVVVFSFPHLFVCLLAFDFCFSIVFRGLRREVRS